MSAKEALVSLALGHSGSHLTPKVGDSNLPPVDRSVVGLPTLIDGLEVKDGAQLVSFPYEQVLLNPVDGV